MIVRILGEGQLERAQGALHPGRHDLADLPGHIAGTAVGMVHGVDLFCGAPRSALAGRFLVDTFVRQLIVMYK